MILTVEEQNIYLDHNQTYRLVCRFCQILKRYLEVFEAKAFLTVLIRAERSVHLGTASAFEKLRSIDRFYKHSKAL